MSDFVTIAKPTDADIATKKVVRMPSGRVLKQGYPRAYKFEFSRRFCESLDDLSKILTELEEQHDKFIIRGNPIHLRGAHRRLYRRCEKTGDEPTLEAVDHRWACIDIDGIEVDESLGEVGSALNVLPDCFSGAKCHYHFTSSHGLEPGQVRVHLWYWLDREVCGASVRKWLKEAAPLVDVSPFSPVQPHYTANPIFVGMDDPVRVRSGKVDGRDCVTLPDFVVDKKTMQLQAEKAKAKAKAKAKMARMKSTAGADTHKKRYALGALRSACEKIESACQGDRHLTIYSEVASVAELHQHLDESDARRQLEQAALAALDGEGRSKEVYRTIDDAWSEGRKKTRRVPEKNKLKFKVKTNKTNTKPEIDHAAIFAARMGEDPEEVKKAIRAAGHKITASSPDIVDFFRDLVEDDLKRIRKQQ